MSPEEHAAKFQQVCANLQRLAGNLIQQHPEFPVHDFAKAFLSTAIGLLLPACGDGGTVDYLQNLAMEIEAEKPRAMN